MKHKVIKDKMKKIEALLSHPIISRHVPETVWFNSRNLENMLARYGTVYIKPNAGSQGNKVIRVQRVREHEAIIAYNKFSRNVLLPDLPSELNSIIFKRKYFIQQGIDLATYQGCPFDIRMVLQKPYATWDLTLTSAKVALKEDAVVTNVSKGAKDYPLLDILRAYDQKQDPMAVLRELVGLAHQFAQTLGSKFPLRIIGFDMAVDKAGKVWFIEANTKPQCARCKLVNDDSSRKRYTEARNIIRAGLLAKKRKAGQAVLAQPDSSSNEKTAESEQPGQQFGTL